MQERSKKVEYVVRECPQVPGIEAQGVLKTVAEVGADYGQAKIHRQWRDGLARLTYNRAYVALLHNHKEDKEDLGDLQGSGKQGVSLGFAGRNKGAIGVRAPGPWADQFVWTAEGKTPSVAWCGGGSRLGASSPSGTPAPEPAPSQPSAARARSVMPAPLLDELTAAGQARGSDQPSSIAGRHIFPSLGA